MEKTLKTALPEGFQKAERVMECGFIDAIVQRKDQKAYIEKILRLHERYTDE